MRKKAIATMAALSMLAAPLVAQAAVAYLYPAKCKKSTLKQGEMQADLTKEQGKPINCDAVIISWHDNGAVLIQFPEKKGTPGPLGFSGSRIDYKMNPNMATIPVERIYLPHVSNPGSSQVVNGVEGFWFIDGKINIRNLAGVACASKMEIGTQKLIYHVQADIVGVGEPMN